MGSTDHSNSPMFDGFDEKFFEFVGNRDSFLLIFAQSSLKRPQNLGESAGDGLRGRRDPPVTLRT